MAAIEKKNGRKERKGHKERTLSFRTKREIFLRSLAFAWDDRASGLSLCDLGARSIRILDLPSCEKLPEPHKES